MFEQGGDSPAFRVNVWDVIAVLLNTVTGMFGLVAGMFNGFAQLARGHAGFIDNQREFHEAASFDIEMITGEGE